MQLRKRNIFTTIRAEGSILPADLLQRINDRDAHLKGLTPDDYHLAGGLKLNEAINQSWNRMQGAWAVFQSALEKLPQTDTGTTVTREKWLLPLVQELGYGRLPAARSIEIEGKSYPISHLWQQTPIHLVSARVDLDTRTAGVAGASRISPHGLTQELLNRSEVHLWGFVSNGLRLRILRKNVSLTRQSYVEFDLEALMNGEQFPDFMMLWLLCHESRVNAEKPQDCWLERWSKAAHEQGTRALGQLRNGVAEAIKALGRGFLAHPANQTLIGRLRNGELNKQDYYRQLLRLVYRLLFLFVAEDRELLFALEADEKIRERYTRFYSVSRLRRLAERRLGARHGDLYHGLRLVMQRLGNGGCTELGLPALGSFLFSDEAIADLNGCELANHELLEAVRTLAFITDGHRRRTVDYKNLRSEELGSVYEALLELHPAINAEAKQFDLPPPVSGNERKETGSYYTPESLVQCLLDSALDPVIAEALKKPEPEKALLNLKVCDPACGSGHFLIAAAHRLAKHLASVRTGDGEPAPEAVCTALRDVIGHCIYGVDINPMAVELCKVSLWMEALEPGKPLSFLEHHIQCGNSLLGATPALLKSGIPDEAFKPIEGDDGEYCAEYRKQNKKERAGVRYLPFDAEVKLGNLATSIAELDAIDDSDIAGVRAKQRHYEELVRSSGYLYGQFLADAWCAAFAWKKTREFPFPITEAVFREIEQNPYHHATGHGGGWLEREVKRLAAQYQFFHWHLAFPDVFMGVKTTSRADTKTTSDAEQSTFPATSAYVPHTFPGWEGGFDVVLGNPPWERVKLQEAEWFAERRPDIAMAPNAATRKRLIANLAEEDPYLYATFRDAIRSSEAESMFLRGSSRFPLCGRGDINSYAVFAETFYLIARHNSSCGLIVPSGILADETTKLFLKELQDTRALAQAIDFENNETLFPGVGHGRMRFCLLTIRKGLRTDAARLFFLARGVADIADSDRWFELRPGDAAAINPNSETCPVFLSKHDAEITKAVYKRFPVLRRETTAESVWGAKLHRVFDMTTDGPLMKTAQALLLEEWTRVGRIFRRGMEVMLPIIEGKMVTFYDHRDAHIRLNPDAPSRQQQTEDTSDLEKQDPGFFPEAYLWAPASVAQERFHEDVNNDWAIAFKRVTSATNWRTMVACVVPDTLAISYTLYLLEVGEAVRANQHCLLAMLNSFAYDYFVRQKTMQPSLPMGPVYETVIPPSSSFDAPASWSGSLPLREWIALRVAELICVSNDLISFARATLGQPIVFRWVPERREALQAELDAMAFHHFGLSRGEVEHVLSTFPKVREYDEKAHGEYRTKRLILEIYDEMRRAMESSMAYQTRLDPLPANGWVPPELVREEIITKSAPQPAETADGKQSDLFKWQAEDPQQQLEFDDTERI